MGSLLERGKDAVRHERAISSLRDSTGAPRREQLIVEFGRRSVDTN
jgi:hypothetical protein